MAEPLLLGDYNFDGTVNAPDYNVWRDSFGSTTELDADGNGDGVINAPDYNVWRDNFGRTANVAVPEPTSIALLVAAIIVFANLFRPRLVSILRRDPVSASLRESLARGNI